MSIEKLNQNQKNSIRHLLEWLSDSIRAAEQNLENTHIDEEIDKIILQVSWLKTQSEAENLLEDVKLQISALREYKNYKKLSIELKDRISEFELQNIKNVKKELWDLKKQISWNRKLNPNTASSADISKAAEAWRYSSSEEIESLVESMATKGWFLWNLARKANWQKS